MKEEKRTENLLGCQTLKLMEEMLERNEAKRVCRQRRVRLHIRRRSGLPFQEETANK